MDFCPEHGRLCERIEKIRTDFTYLLQRVNEHLNNDNHISRHEVVDTMRDIKQQHEKELNTVTECVRKLVERVEQGEKERLGHWGRVWSNWGPPVLAAIVALTVAIVNRLWQ